MDAPMLSYEYESGFFHTVSMNVGSHNDVNVPEVITACSAVVEEASGAKPTTPFVEIAEAGELYPLTPYPPLRTAFVSDDAVHVHTLPYFSSLFSAALMYDVAGVVSTHVHPTPLSPEL
jgi:hypothetical protein